jgi:hypothetical protein
MLNNKIVSVAAAQAVVPVLKILSPCDICRFNKMPVEWCNEYCHGWDVKEEGSASSSFNSPAPCTAKEVA